MRNRAGTCRLSWCLCAIVALLSPSIIANGATSSTADPFQLLEEAPRHACGDEVSSLYNTIDAYYIPSYSLEWYLAQLVVTLKEELLYYHIDTDWSRDACIQVWPYDCSDWTPPPHLPLYGECLARNGRHPRASGLGLDRAPHGRIA